MRISIFHTTLAIILASAAFSLLILQPSSPSGITPKESGDDELQNRVSRDAGRASQAAEETFELQRTPAHFRLHKVPAIETIDAINWSREERFRFSPVNWLTPWGSQQDSTYESIDGMGGGETYVGADGLEWTPLMGGVGGGCGGGNCGQLGELDLGGPWREPSAGRYRIRGGDGLQFTFQQTRQQLSHSYRLAYGDQIRVSSDTHPELNVSEPIEIMPDGTISIPGLQSVSVADLTLAEARELLEEKLVTIGKYHSPRITLLPVRVYQRLTDLLAAVSSQFQNGGQRLELTVIRDGSISLPLIGTICVVGLTREELAAEVNARYSQVVTGIAVTVNVTQTAPAFVYVMGQVAQPGRLEARLPITAWQAVAQAGGHLQGANLRQVVILRRTEDWRLVATTLDLSSANRARPSNFPDLWLWDSDVILVPKARIQRTDELINLYLTQGVYSLFPSQLQLDQASVF